MGEIPPLQQEIPFMELSVSDKLRLLLAQSNYLDEKLSNDRQTLLHNLKVIQSGKGQKRQYSNQE